MNNMTLDKATFDKLEPGEFASGLIANTPAGIYMIDSRIGDMMIWVAVKGYADDWCIYIHWEESGKAFVQSNGDKIFNKDNINKLVSCTPEVLSMYRF